jgi:MEMO1 family protein
MGTRKADFAGSWYPSSASECEREIESFLKGGRGDGAPEPTVGGIVPHAGWFFSGAIACNVINALKDESPPEVIVVFGMHLHPASPSYIMTEGSWATPFGEIPIHETIAKEVAGKFPFKIETPERYTRDNTIELQLPFIKYFFENSKIVPVGAPPSKKSLEIGAYVADLAIRSGIRMKIVGSTDLTHYGSNYAFAPKGSGKDALDWVRNENDKRVIDAMLEMDPEKVVKEGLSSQNACCAGAAAAAISAGKRLGATKARLLTYATSHDKSPGESFVGYAGIVF